MRKMRTDCSCENAAFPRKKDGFRGAKRDVVDVGISIRVPGFPPKMLRLRRGVTERVCGANRHRESNQGRIFPRGVLRYVDRSKPFPVYLSGVPAAFVSAAVHTQSR